MRKTLNTHTHLAIVWEGLGVQHAECALVADPHKVRVVIVARVVGLEDAVRSEAVEVPVPVCGVLWVRVNMCI